MRKDPFEEFFKNEFLAPDLMKEMNAFRTDIQDLGDHYLLEADLPGFDKKDINLEIRDHRLIISAERKEEKEEKDEKKNYIRRERSYGSFSRSFDLSEIDEEKIGASYTDGVLKITMPKTEKTPESTKQISIE